MSLTESPAVVHGLGAGPSHAANHADAQRPLRLHPLDHIVAGHTVQGKDAMLGADGRLYKPVQKGEKGQREVKFYERTGLLCPALHPFLPAYYGTLEYDTRQYLALEDIAVQFREPCVLDLKMGVRTYEPTASAEKVASELTKGPHQEQIGFRPCGMRVYGTVSGKYTFRSKRWGQSIEPGTAHSMLAEFMRDDTAERTVRRIERVVPALVLRLRALERTLEQLVGLRFYASSIILVFEGTPEHGGAAVRPSSPPRRAGAPHAGDAALGPRALVDVRMVDFAHWVRVDEPGPDEGYLAGLRNVIGYLEHILSARGTIATHLEMSVPEGPRFVPGAVPPFERDSQSQSSRCGSEPDEGDQPESAEHRAPSHPAAAAHASGSVGGAGRGAGA